MTVLHAQSERDPFADIMDEAFWEVSEWLAINDNGGKLVQNTRERVRVHWNARELELGKKALSILERTRYTDNRSTIVVKSPSARP